MNKEEEFYEKVNSIYSHYKDDENSEYKLTDILYYKDLTLIEPNDEIDYGIAEQDVFAAKKVNEEKKERYDLYIYIKDEKTQEEERVLIATIDENGQLEFSEDYIDILKNIDERFVDLINSERENENSTLNLGEIDADKVLSEEELEKISDKVKEDKDEYEPQNEEDEEIEKIAEVTGLKPSDISAKSRINPQSHITEHETFADVTGIGENYENIYVINANGDTEQSGKFAFVGITKDGEAEYVDALQTKGTTVTDRNVYSMNRDGSVLEKKQVTEMFSTNDPNKMLSVTIGTYGIIDVDYLRRSSEENKYISSPVETDVQRPNNWEVKRLMDSRNTAKSELNEMLDKTEEQFKQVNTSNISQIDDVEGNEEYDIDQEIKLGQNTTTIRKEAEAAGLSPKEYIERMQKASGDTIGDKVNYIREDVEKENREKEEGHFHEEDKGERKLFDWS